jgi:hypothetical protein
MSDVYKEPTNREIIAARAKWLKEKFGELTPKIFVDDAKKKSSPLHTAAGFNWNVREAAEAHWTDHARRVIATIELRITVENVTYTAPAFVRDPQKTVREQGYVAMDDVATDPKLARQVVEQEIVQVRARLERLEQIARPLGLQPLVSAMLTSLQTFQRHAKSRRVPPKNKSQQRRATRA